MSCSIAAATTSGGGLISTADATGSLDIKSGTTTIVAVTSAGVSVTGTLTASGAVTLASPVLSGSITGTYTLAGTPTITSPTITGATISTMNSSVITSGTTVATTSGTSIDFTSIPSWVKRVTVIMNSVGSNGSSNFLLQIGSGSVTTSGYSSTSTYAGSSTSGIAGITAGFVMWNGGGSETHAGHYTITLLSSNTYVGSGVQIYTNGQVYSAQNGGTSPALAGALDRIRLTTSNGTDTFDAGSINIIYE